MSLNIYSSEKFIPAGIQVCFGNDEFFNAKTVLLDNEITTNVLRKIDKATRNSDLTFIGRDNSLGALNKDMLSSGTKTALNVVVHPDACFSLVECGSNVLKLIVELGSGNVLWRCPVLHLEEDIHCDIVFDGRKRFDSFFEFQKYVMSEECDYLDD